MSNEKKSRKKINAVCEDCSASALGVTFPGGLRRMLCPECMTVVLFKLECRRRRFTELQINNMFNENANEYEGEIK